MYEGWVVYKAWHMQKATSGGTLASLDVVLRTPNFITLSTMIDGRLKMGTLERLGTIKQPANFFTRDERVVSI